MNVTIRDDDAAILSITADATSVNEGSTAVFTVELMGGVTAVARYRCELACCV